MNGYEGATASEATREIQIPAELERLSKAIEYLFNAADKLEGRLSPVTEPAPPSGDSRDKAPQEARVPVADAIWTAAVRVDLTARRLEDMTRRLQV